MSGQTSCDNPLQGSRLLFIGGGNMASAIIGGLLRRSRLAHVPDGSAMHLGSSAGATDTLPQITVIEPSEAARRRWSGNSRLSTGNSPAEHSPPDPSTMSNQVRVVSSPTELIQDTRPFDLAVLAVKPQHARGALEASAALLAQSPGIILLSIAAGLRSESIAQWSGVRRVARAMPNTPALVGQGQTGLWHEPGMDSNARRLVRSVVTAVGACIDVPEENGLDAVTAVSGSGPAYVFFLMEAMVDSATKLGLDPAAAHQLVIGTVRGAAALAGASNEAPAELRRQVTSPGGTTAAAIEVLETRHFAGAIDSAIAAAHARSIELAKPPAGD